MMNFTKSSMRLLNVISTFIIFSLFVVNNVNAQHGIGVTNPDPSAAFEVSSTTKGVLISRMSTAQMNAIPSPATGLMVYNTDVNCFYTYRGATLGWKSQCDPNDIGVWGIEGNTGTSATTNFIGTKDLVDFIMKTNNTERLRILGSNGRVGIGTNAPIERLHIYDDADSYLKIDGPGAAGKGVMLSTGGTNEWLIRRPAATNYLGFFDASITQEALTIFAGGNVGIGLNAAAPSNKLHISATANPIRLEGLQTGAGADSIVTVNATGVLRKRTLADVLSTGSTWLNGGNNLTSPGIFGSTSNQPFSIITNNTSVLTFGTNGSITQGAGAGQVTYTGNVDATNGLDVTNAPLTANAGATITGSTVNLNNTGTGTTNIGNCAGPSTTNIDGATNINTSCASPTTIGNTTNGVTNIAGTTGITGATTVTGATNINTLGSATTAIGNASATNTIAGTTTVTGATNINASGNGITTIGNASATNNVVGATNINTTGSGITTVGNASGTTNIDGTNLFVNNLPTGAGTDEVVVVDAATGETKKVPMSTVGANAFTVDNGLTKTASNVQLGGTLVQATNIAQAGFDLTTTGTGNFGVGTATPNSKFTVSGSFATAISTKTASYTATAADHIIIVDATGGNRTITLPSAVGLDGRQYIIKKKDNSVNNVIIAAAGSETIDGAATVIMSIQWQVRTIVSDGANWMIISNQ